jgi:hypothetical protein
MHIKIKSTFGPKLSLTVSLVQNKARNPIFIYGYYRTGYMQLLIKLGINQEIIFLPGIKSW